MVMLVTPLASFRAEGPGAAVLELPVLDVEQPAKLAITAAATATARIFLFIVVPSCWWMGQGWS
jgi:hypothetical protein